VGSLCAAVYSVDNDWYRGRVEEMIRSDEVHSVNDISDVMSNMLIVLCEVLGLWKW